MVSSFETLIRHVLTATGYIHAIGYSFADARETSVKIAGEETNVLQLAFFAPCIKTEAAKVIESLRILYGDSCDKAEIGSHGTNYNDIPGHEVHVYLNDSTNKVLAGESQIPSIIRSLEQGKIVRILSDSFRPDTRHVFKEEDPVIVQARYIKPNKLFWQMDEKRAAEISPALNAPYSFNLERVDFLSTGQFKDLSWTTKIADTEANIITMLRELGIKAEEGRNIPMAIGEEGNFFMMIRDYESQVRLHDLCHDFRSRCTYSHR